MVREKEKLHGACYYEGLLRYQMVLLQPYTDTSYHITMLQGASDHSKCIDSYISIYISVHIYIYLYICSYIQGYE